jgi:uncharacterized protein
MSSSWSVASANLTSVAVLVFILGFIGAKLKSELKLPESVYQMISIYLLFGIGLKGGHSLKSVTPESFIKPALATIFLGILIPIVAFYSLKFIRNINDMDRGAIAAHYGSTSLVTFSAALLYLESNVIEVEGFMTAILTLLEIPGLIVGIYLGSRRKDEKVQWAQTLREVVTGKTVLLLAGGLGIGAVTSVSGYLKVSPFFIDLQGGFLVLFLLHLGYQAGSNWNEVKKVGPKMIGFGIVFPIVSGAIGVATGIAVDLSIGGATVLGVLCASGSYIAAPAAVAIGLPKANSSLALMSSIGVTFPFNLIFGIPLYLEMARLYSTYL